MANLVPLSNSSLIKPKKSAIIKADKFLVPRIKPTSAIVKFSGRTSETLGGGGALVEIEKKVVQIDKLLKDSLLLSKKEGEKKRVSEEQKEFDKREKELEKNKPKPIPGIKLPSLPKMGFLDWIKNFITQTILGFFAVRLIEHLPKLLSLLPTIIKVSDFVVGIGGKLLDGLISFVDFGYKAYDATRGFIKNLGGNELAKNFDKFAGALNTMLDVAVLAALSAASMGGGFGGPPSDPTMRSRGVFGRGGARAGTRLGLKTIGKDATKQVLRFIKPIAGRAPLIGGLLEFGISWALGDPVGKAAFRGIGASLIGAIGTVIGGPIGLAIGGLAGGELGGLLYDAIFNNKKPPNKVAKAAGGGMPATRSGKLVAGPAKRTIKKKKKPRTLSFTPRKIKPGANTGGEAKVQQVFPNPDKPTGFFGWLGGLFGGGNQQQQQKQQKPKEKTANPQEFLVGSNDVLGRAKFFGPLATIVLKTVLGQQPDDLDYRNAGKGLNAWVQTTFGGGTLGFAGGGEVDARQYFSGEDYTDVIAKTIKESVTKEVDTTIRNLSKELALRPVGRDEMLEQNQRMPSADDMGEGAGVQVSSDSEDFWLLATAAMFENSHPQGAADVAQVIYNRTKYPAWNAPTIRKAILNPGQFQPVRQYGGTASWASIKTKADALKFSKSHGKTQEQLERVAAALLDKNKQDDARRFVGPRDSFRADAYERANNHLANETEKSRHGHTFGFEPGGAMIGQFKAGKLSAAQVNANVRGDVSQYSDIGTGKFKVIEYITGDVNHPNLDIPGHGMPGNYHDHIAFATIAEKERAKRALISAGIKIGSEFRPGDPGYHGRNLAIDVPGYQWGGSGAIGSKEFSGSRRVRSILGIGKNAPKFHGGLILNTGNVFAHKGEFVIDKDSVDLFGVDFVDSINRVENKAQLITKAPSIIEKLKAISGYTDYENPEPEVIIVEVPVNNVVPVPIGSGGGVFVGGGIDNKVPGMEALHAIG